MSYGWIGHMSYSTAFAIAFRSITAIVLFGAAAYLGYFIQRAGRRRGWNGRIWRYLTKPHAVRPKTEEDRHDWQAVIWPLAAFLLIAVIIWFTDPTH